MNFETVLPDEINKSPKEKFLNALEVELKRMEAEGEISPERAKEKRESAILIEEGFSDDVSYDALIFAKAGIASEKEMVNIFQSVRETVPETQREEAPLQLRKYFENYISDADSQDNEENKEGFEDYDRIKGILQDIDGGDYSSARNYLDGEITRMQSIHQGMQEEGRMSLGDIEEGIPYLEKITKLREGLNL